MKLNLLAMILVLNFAVVAQKVAPAKIGTLLVEVENGKSLMLNAADLAKLPRKEINAKDHDGKATSYSGVDLREILTLAGAKLGKELRGALMSAFVVIDAADGYKVVFGVAEIDSEFTDKSVILADLQEGKPLTAANGPWQVVVPDDKRHGRWVRQVTAIHFKYAK